MAVGTVGVQREDCQYGGRITAYVVLSCVTASMGGIIFGYDIGVAGTIQLASAGHGNLLALII